MTDIEHIQAFRLDNQHALSRFYKEYRDGFIRDIGRYYNTHNPDLLSDIYQESVIRLWNNIQRGKLSEQTLTSTLAGYLFSIGRNVALEIFRKEGVRLEKNIDEAEAEISKSNAVTESVLWTESEQEKAVRSAVYAMQEPCAPLLLMFYWDKLSWENIAKQLHYKDANSAKTQKYKCIQKLKAHFL